jgi:hypothetical protein
MVGVSLSSPDFLQKREYLSLVSRRSFRGLLLAQRRSQTLGSDLAFAGHREYSYRHRFAQYQDGVSRFCRPHGLGCTQTATTVAFDELVLKMMRAPGAVQGK